MSPRPVSLGLCSQELQKEAKSHKALLDSLNEVSAALLELVPWRAREGLGGAKAASDTLGLRVQVEGLL